VKLWEWSQRYNGHPEEFGDSRNTEYVPKKATGNEWSQFKRDCVGYNWQMRPEGQSCPRTLDLTSCHHGSGCQTWNCRRVALLSYGLLSFDSSFLFYSSLLELEWLFWAIASWN
jgi:hypothetical protein